MNTIRVFLSHQPFLHSSSKYATVAILTISKLTVTYIGIKFTRLNIQIS
jgi:hypothetical protein